MKYSTIVHLTALIGVVFTPFFVGFAVAAYTLIMWEAPASLDSKGYNYEDEAFRLDYTYSRLVNALNSGNVEHIDAYVCAQDVKSVNAENIGEYLGMTEVAGSVTVDRVVLPVARNGEFIDANMSVVTQNWLNDEPVLTRFVTEKYLWKVCQSELPPMPENSDLWVSPFAVPK